MLRIGRNDEDTKQAQTYSEYSLNTKIRKKKRKVLSRGKTFDQEYLEKYWSENIQRL